MKVSQGTDSQKKDAAAEILNGKWLVHHIGTIYIISQCISVILICTKNGVAEDFEHIQFLLYIIL